MSGYDEEDEVERYENGKALAVEFCENTTAHGLNRIVGAERWWGKLFWSVLFVGLFSYMLVQEIEIVTDFLGWPVSTTIFVETAQNQQFPAVTICNQNRIKASLAAQSVKYSTLPAIDKSMCACRYVGGVSGGASGRRRKKRSLIPEIITNSLVLKDVHECAQTADEIDFAELPKYRVNAYKKRFKREIQLLNQDIEDNNLQDQFPDEFSKLNHLHYMLTEPGRDILLSEQEIIEKYQKDQKLRKRRTTFLKTADQVVDEFDYSQYVKNSTDWWGFLNVTDAKDYGDIANLATVTKADTKLLGHPPDEFIISCNFDQNEKCSYRDFQQFQHRRYGNCYTFNTGAIQGQSQTRQTSRFGSEYGLTLVLFIHQDEYVGLFTQEAGVRVAIHNPENVPFPESHGFNAGPGTNTNFNIRINQNIRSPDPYGNCTEQNQIENNVYDGRYSFLGCNKACIQSTLKEECGCIDDINTLFTDVPICDILDRTQVRCREKINTMFENDELACNCVQRCQETSYSVQYSTTKWPSDKYEGYLFSALSHVPIIQDVLVEGIEQTLKNVVKLQFTFEELNVQTIEESPKYTNIDLFSSVGGLLGLYVGISIVTVFEFLDFVIKLAINCFCGGPSKGDSSGTTRIATPHKIDPQYGIM